MRYHLYTASCYYKSHRVNWPSRKRNLPECPRIQLQRGKRNRRGIESLILHLLNYECSSSVPLKSKKMNNTYQYQSTFNVKQNPATVKKAKVENAYINVASTLPDIVIFILLKHSLLSILLYALINVILQPNAIS